MFQSYLQFKADLNPPIQGLACTVRTQEKRRAYAYALVFLMILGCHHRKQGLWKNRVNN